jgi:hypothetical protein
VGSQHQPSKSSFKMTKQANLDLNDNINVTVNGWGEIFVGCGTPGVEDREDKDFMASTVDHAVDELRRGECSPRRNQIVMIKKCSEDQVKTHMRE